MNSLRGAKPAFSGTMSSLMGINTVLREIIDSEVKIIFEDLYSIVSNYKQWNITFVHYTLCYKNIF